MRNKPTFSFIVPVYNTSAYLNKCIESIINQSYTDIETILINDGSTDNSGRICDEYAQKDSRIKVIHKENEGLSAARNDGMTLATGDYIIFVDSDDFIELETCDIFKAIIDANPDIEIIASNYKVIRPKYFHYQKFYIPENNTTTTGHEFLKSQMKRRKMRIASCQSIYKRAFVHDNDLSFKKGYLHEDELWTPIAYLRANSVIATDFVHYNYFVREGSLTQSKNAIKQGESKILIAHELEVIYNNIKDKELKSLLMNTLVNKFFSAFMSLKQTTEWEKHKHLFSKTFLKGKARSLNNKWRVFMFLVLGETIYYNIKVISRFFERRFKQLMKILNYNLVLKWKDFKC